MSWTAFLQTLGERQDYALTPCQATAKTGPEATRKLVYPVERITKESRRC